MLDEIALIMIMRDVSNVAQDWSVDDKADQERDAEALEAFGDEVAVASFRERVRSGDAGKKKHQGHEPGADQNDDERERLYVFEEDVVLLAPGVVGHAGVIEDQQRDLQWVYFNRYKALRRSICVRSIAQRLSNNF